ncbi:MAG: aspartyl/asparaginyl beta-hydroxylase domain-containing protein [Albidovulum sp.]|nr:aspartyl/asparaginyl beta-hydroxylase domain-containing protein [Albidovulum sp.]MDE0530572.1 aspartyl/asparaginyl beta-hydroxylase domain-containing protein [Albidovulum sp.]
MMHFTRISESEDISPILEELEVSPEMWLADTSRQRNVRCQRNTRNIFLRAARKPLPPGARNANDVHESRIAPAARNFSQTLEYCQRVADAQEGQLGRATLVALLPECKVFPHIDAGEYYRIRDRFHLVLKSSLGSPLTTEGETVVMREGELWVFNNKAMHWAENSSTEERVHLIFDVLPHRGRGFYVFPQKRGN